MGCSGNESGKNDGGTNGGKDTLIIGRGGDSTSLDPITTTEGEAFKVFPPFVPPSFFPLSLPEHPIKKAETDRIIPKQISQLFFFIVLPPYW